MNRFVKWALATVAVVVILVFVAAVLLPRFIDPNSYKSYVSDVVFRETGKELIIAGNIKWRMFPVPGLSVSDMALTEPGESVESAIVSIGEAHVAMQLMPLLRKRMEIGSVELNDMSISIREPDSPLSGVVIRDANIRLVPVTQVMTADENGASMQQEQAFDLGGDFSVNVTDAELQGAVSFSSRLKPSRRNGQVALEGMEMSFSGRRGAGDQAIQVESTSSGNAEIDLANDRANLRDFVFTLFDLELRGLLDVASISSSPVFEGQVEIAEFSPRSLRRDLGMEELQTHNPQALSSLAGELQFDYSDNGFHLSDMLIQLDGSQLAGYFSLNDFESPNIDFSLQADQVNLDDYASTAGNDDADTGSPGTDLGVDTFRGVAGGGSLRIGSLTLSGMTATDVEARVIADRTSVRVQPFNANFYGGRNTGDITIDARGSKPLMKANLDLTGIRVGELLEDLGDEARLQGQADVFLRLESDISNTDSSLSSLTGDMGLLVTNGSIVGIDVAKTLSLVSLSLGKNENVSSQAGDDQRTEFGELSMTGTFNEGVLRSEDLLMQSPLMNATGNGSYNVVDDSLDFLLFPVLAEGTGIETLDKLNGVTIPIRLTGSLESPAYGVDMQAAVDSYQQALIKQKANDLLKKLLK